MSNIEKNFEKNGYVIIDGDKASILKLRSKITNILKKNNSSLKALSDDKIMNNFHKFYTKKKINDIRFKVYNSLNNLSIIRDIYYNSCKSALEIIIGNEVAMQKKVNLSIQMPNDEDSLLDMHSDIYAGESPFQVVVWMPLVDAYSTKSMFITNPKQNKFINKTVLNSKKNTTRDIYIKNKKKFKFLDIKFGQILIFSPLILHGNVINKTMETRFSLNCRFKSLLSPYDVTVKSHRNIPQFYKPLNTKPMTKIGFKYLMKYEKK